MTDNEIIKALECCGEEDIHLCSICPIYLHDKDNAFCQEDLHRMSLDLINRQKAEIERLKARCENTQIGYNFLKADFEELKEDKIIAERKEKDARDLFKSAVGQLKQAKSEARKEFAERLKERNKIYCINAEDAKEMDFVIDNLVKEMECSE